MRFIVEAAVQHWSASPNCRPFGLVLEGKPSKNPLQFPFSAGTGKLLGTGTQARRSSTSPAVSASPREIAKSITIEETVAASTRLRIGDFQGLRPKDAMAGFHEKRVKHRPMADFARRLMKKTTTLPDIYREPQNNQEVVCGPSGKNHTCRTNEANLRWWHSLCFGSK